MFEAAIQQDYPQVSVLFVANRIKQINFRNVSSYIHKILLHQFPWYIQLTKQMIIMKLQHKFQVDTTNPRSRGGSVDKMLGDKSNRKQSGRKVKSQTSISCSLSIRHCWRRELHPAVQCSLQYHHPVLEGPGPAAGQCVHKHGQQGLEEEGGGQEWRTLASTISCIFTILQALQLMRALVTGGAGQVEQFPGRLKYLELTFECCVRDLRSQVGMWREVLVF